MLVQNFALRASSPTKSLRVNASEIVATIDRLSVGHDLTVSFSTCAIILLDLRKIFLDWQLAGEVNPPA